MKTWQGITEVKENKVIEEIENKYKFSTESNPNKKYEGTLKEDKIDSIAYNSVYSIIEQINKMTSDKSKKLHLLNQITERVNGYLKNFKNQIARED